MSQETKNEIQARIDELENISHTDEVSISSRIQELREELEKAPEDLSASIIRSHVALCRAKQMGEKEAYGNDPAMYYTLGICGEAGELANEIVKAQRNGADHEKVLEAVKSELPDVVIYSHVLAHVLDVDLIKLVNQKVDVVIQRANDGYYGGPLKR
jgi:NTP pyrophosphatase (non-canonical NTP hydrolase)